MTIMAKKIVLVIFCQFPHCICYLLDIFEVFGLLSSFLFLPGCALMLDCILVDVLVWDQCLVYFAIIHVFDYVVISFNPNK